MFVPRLQEHHRIAISAFWGLDGAPIEWEGIPVLPGLGGDWGSLFLAGHAKALFGAPENCLILTLMDTFVLKVDELRENGLRLASWCPVDHDPLSPQVDMFFEGSGSIPIAMSRYGEERLADHDPLYVPHGIDTEVFRPYDQAEIRRKLNCPEDVFIVGMVAANKGPSRKGFAQAIEAFARFQETREDARLYLHTDIKGQVSGGLPLDSMIKAYGIPEERIMISDQYRLYFSPFAGSEMAKLYSSFDVLLNPAMGEGFGIPCAEAQACGTPTIVTDFSAMSEVNAGWKVGGQRMWTGQRSWQLLPFVDEIVGCLEEAYEMSSAKRTAMSTAARQHVRQYDVELVMREHMLPALAEIEERIDEPSLSVAA